MSLQVSTGFKRLLLRNFPGIFNGGLIWVYDSVQPGTADQPVNDTPIAVVTRNGLPPGFGEPATLNFAVSDPYVVNPYTDVWSLTTLRDGEAKWFRLIGPTPDDGDLSYDLPRIDGDVSVAAGTGILRIPNLVLLTGDAISPVSFIYTIPPIIGD